MVATSEVYSENYENGYVKRFGDRTKCHSDYVEEVIEELKEHKCVVEYYGAEKNIHKDFLSQVISLIKDPTASYLRFQPDLAGIEKTTPICFLAEVKSRCGTHKSAFIELLPFEKVLDLRSLGIKIFYILPDFKTVYPEKITMDEIHVPDRWDRDAYLRIKEKYRATKVKYTKWSNNGSGTIYFIVKEKQLNSFFTIDEFLMKIRNRISLCDFL